MSRAKIKIGDAEIDIEGEETFIKAEIDRFQQMLTVVPQRRIAIAATANQNDAELSGDEQQSATPRTRKVVKKSGPSCAERVLAMKDNNFFAQPKTARDISAKLKELATPYASNQLAAALTSVTKRGLLRRYDEDGAFRYVNP